MRAGMGFTKVLKGILTNFYDVACIILRATQSLNLLFV